MVIYVQPKMNHDLCPTLLRYKTNLKLFPSFPSLPVFSTNTLYIYICEPILFLLFLDASNGCEIITGIGTSQYGEDSRFECI